MKQSAIPVYAANLLRRTDRRKSLESQFSGRDEFDLHIVTAIELENGVWGQWQTFFRIVKQEAEKGTPYFVFCEDDHAFTDEYSETFLRERIREADGLEADLLLGGMSWLRNPVQVSDHLFWTEAFNGMQFAVVYRRFYDTILSYETEKGYVTDKFLSEVSDRVFVIYPYISVQGEFGYSDVTSQNNEAGRVPFMFNRMGEWLRRLDKVRAFYRGIALPAASDMPDFGDFCLPTYIIHLSEHVERREHMERQMAGHGELDVRWVDACRHKMGNVGLWCSIRKIVEKAEADGEDVILICEDDHTFTPFYNRLRFMRQVWLGGMMGTDIMLGGIGGFGSLAPVRDGLYWFDWAWCTQFMVVYRRAFKPILDAKFGDRDVADEFLSRLLTNKLAVCPFVSEQTDFGYSDVTAANNHSGQIVRHFEASRRHAEIYMRATARYRAADGFQPDATSPLMGSYLETATPKALHLGCGTNLLEGWLNTDTNPVAGASLLDAALPFPFADGTFDYIFSEHMFEHLAYDEGKSMLCECHRTLKSGGVLRLTMPTLDFLKRMMDNPDAPQHQHYASWSLQKFAPRMYADFAADHKPLPMSLVVNNFMRMWGHRMLYDRSTLFYMLEKAGFRNVILRQSGVSPHPFLCGCEQHGTVIPEWANQMESMTVEAEK